MQNNALNCEYCGMEDFPSISLVLPFEPKMNNEDHLKKMLIREAQKIEEDILQKYPAKAVEPLIQKLHEIIAKVTYKPNKGIGIFVSPVAEKLYFFSPVPDTFKKFPPVKKVLP